MYSSISNALVMTLCHCENTENRQRKGISFSNSGRSLNQKTNSASAKQPFLYIYELYCNAIVSIVLYPALSNNYNINIFYKILLTALNNIMFSFLLIINMFSVNLCTYIVFHFEIQIQVIMLMQSYICICQLLIHHLRLIHIQQTVITFAQLFHFVQFV